MTQPKITQPAEGENVQKSCLRCPECKKLAVLLGITLVIGLVAGYFLGGALSSSPLSPLELVQKKKKAVIRSAPGEKGPVLATIEGEAIVRKLFDLQLNLTLQNAQGIPQEQLVQRKNDPAFLKQFLEQIIQSRIILMAMETDPVFKGDPEIPLVMDLLLVDGLSKYYLSKKAGESTVSTNVTDEEIGQIYNQVRQDPQYAAVIDRLPFDEIKERLAVDIVRQRQLEVVRKQVQEIRDMLRIAKFDDKVFGPSPMNATNAGMPPLGGL
jgi:hypothetical protein